MAHYAFLDDNNIVTEVIVGVDENQLIDGLDPETWYGNFRGQNCVRTSYNTLAGQHLTGGVPFRGTFAGIGFSYDPIRDIFIPPKPPSNPSFIFDEKNAIWTYPTPKPSPLPEGRYWEWDEETVSWKDVPRVVIE
jgi:hypothetical protein